MTVQELMDELSRFEPEQQVRYAAQPNWAMEYDLGAVIEVALDDDEDADQPVVYIGEGAQRGYLPSGVADEVWR